MAGYRKFAVIREKRLTGEKNCDRKEEILYKA